MAAGMISPLTLILIAFATLSSCARHRALPDDIFTLATRITTTGLKQFEVTFPYAPRQLVLTGRGNKKDERNRDDAGRLPRQRMEQIVAARISETGYCREGYLLLGTQAGNTVQRVRGECRDLANEQDRMRFEDTITRW